MIDTQYYVYIVTNKNNTVLYTGVTNNLKKRVYFHKMRYIKSFSKKYNADKLVYYEVTDNIIGAIAREKQIKDGSRSKKMKLINEMNEAWVDLYPDL